MRRDMKQWLANKQATKHYYNIIKCFVLDGKFAAYMQVEIQNDGPVTIQIDSPTAKNEV